MAPIAAPIQLIVEGPGDEKAVPVLLRRYLQEKLLDYRPTLLGQPIVAKGLGNLTKEGGIEGFLRIAASRSETKVIIVVIDADRECIKQRAEELAPRMLIGIPVVLVMADKNFEDWIYASAETVFDSEATYTEGSSALFEIKRHREKYIKSVDQAKLASKIDLDLARSRNRSLDRFLDRFESSRLAHFPPN